MDPVVRPSRSEQSSAVIKPPGESVGFTKGGVEVGFDFGFATQALRFEVERVGRVGFEVDEEVGEREWTDAFHGADVKQRDQRVAGLAERRRTHEGGGTKDET